MDPRWFAPHTAYTIAKYGMSMCVLGHAAEFSPYGIAVNALWPATVIQTANPPVDFLSIFGRHAVPWITSSNLNALFQWSAPNRPRGVPLAKRVTVRAGS
jgi:NAD(P)-dependent dehydrogenase (short-subunit alcohol dehydrogenase family)